MSNPRSPLVSVLGRAHASESPQADVFDPVDLTPVHGHVWGKYAVVHFKSRCWFLHTFCTSIVSTLRSAPVLRMATACARPQIPGKSEAGVKLVLMAMVSNKAQEPKGKAAGAHDEEDQFFG